MRRSTLVRFRGLVAIVAMAGALAACGGGGNNSAGGNGTADPAGVLKYGYPLPVAGAHFDSAHSTLAVDVMWMSMVYGTLMRQYQNGSIEPWMAKSVTVKNPTTVEIDLRPGVKFSDGSPYDAAAVKTSLERASKVTDPTVRAGLDPAMKVLTGVDVTGPLTAVAHLSAPLAGEFVTELSLRPGAIESPKQIASNSNQIDASPVGAGPFELVKNTPGQLLSFRRNPGYWDASQVKLGGVDIINTPTGPQQANGLLAGTLDWASYVSPGDVNSLTSAGHYKTDVSQVYTVEMLMCTGKAPFNNQAVRQAIQVGIDRQRFNQLAFNGIAQPATSFFRSGDPNFSANTKQVVTYDPTRAKQLLASAGASNLSVDVHYPTTLDFSAEGQALQGQLKSIGVNVNLVADRDIVAGFIAPQKPGAMMVATIGSPPGYGLISRSFSPGGFFALCGVSRPDVMSAVNRAVGYDPSDPKAIAAYQKAQDLIAENAYVIPIVSYPTVAGWNSSRVGGTPKWSTLGYPQFDSFYIQK